MRNPGRKTRRETNPLPLLFLILALAVLAQADGVLSALEAPRAKAQPRWANAAPDERLIFTHNQPGNRP